MITKEIATAKFPAKQLGELAEFLDSQRRPVRQEERKPGVYPYYGANGQQGTIDGFIFDEPLILLAEDGGFFDEPNRGIAYQIAGKSWVNNHAHVIRPKSDRVDPSFLYRVLQNYDVRPFISGTTRGKLTKGQAEKILVPLPSLADQRRIAVILDGAEALRHKRKRSLDLIESLVESSFVQMFGDEKSSRFAVKKLELVADQVTDGAHFTPTYVDNGVPFLRVTDIQNKAPDWAKVKYIPEEEHRQLILRCKPEPGDILLSKNGTIRLPKFIDWERTFSIFVSLCLIKPKKGVLSGRYLASFLKTQAAQRQLRQHSKTGTVTNLHLVEIRKLLVPIPPFDVQQVWEGIEARIGKKADQLAKAVVAIDGLFSSLQHRAFSGQL